MSHLTRLSLANRTVILLLSLLTIGLGVFATTTLKQELIPSIDLPSGAVVTVYAGAAPQVVETEVSQPIESAVKALEGVTTVTSKSSSSMSQVSLQWDYGASADEMGDQIRRAVESLSLPEGVEPQVITGSFDDYPVVILALSSDADAEQLAAGVDDLVVPTLESLPGVREVSVAGQEQHEVIITWDEDKVEDAGVDPTSISSYFLANSTAIPSGTIRSDTANIDVQTGSTFASIEDLEDLRLLGSDGPVRLGDIATVAEEAVETTSTSRVNGRPALTLSLTKEADANTVSVAHEVDAALAGLKQGLGNNADFTVVFDQAPFIEQSIHDLSVEGGIGLAMAVLVILVFLGSLRPTVITAISIPLSLLIALIGLWVGGYSLNILTLGALTVAIGRVVDDSIVVIENIKRHQGAGEFGRGAITGAVREVAGAITSSTLTTVAVFLPIGLVGGQAGEIFRPFAMTVTIALLASLLVSLTVVPVLASWFMRPTSKQLAVQAEQQPAEERDTWLQRAFLPVLGWTLAHRWITLLIAFGIFVGTIALTPGLKTDFIGDSGQENLVISQKLPAGTSLEETDAAARRIETILAAQPEVESYQTSVGSSSSFISGQADTNEANFTIALKSGSDGTLVAPQVRQKVAELGEDAGVVEVAVGSSSSNGMVLYVESSDPDKLAAGNEQVLTMLRGIDGLTNISSDLSEARQMLQLDVDEEKAAELGMTQVQIGQAVARSVRGQKIGTLAQQDSTLDVYLRSPQRVADIKELRNLELPVTQVMNANAMKDAADKVTRRSEKMQEDAKKAGQDAYDEQVAALRKSRSQAVSSQKQLGKQVQKASKQLNSLKKQLSQLTELCTADPTNPQCAPGPAGIFGLTQQVSGAATALAQLSAAQGQAKAGISQVDKQLESLAESREASLDSAAEQEKLAQDSKDAQEATADPVRLKDVAAVTMVDAPAVITRVDTLRAATVTATNEGSDLGTTTALIEAGVASLDLPDGVEVRIGGVSAQQAESFEQLGLAMAVAVAVVYLIMVATFGSLLQPLILLVSIPFAATGALGLSLLTDTPIGLPSMIGLLMLIGIVVTNAIVLIDLINQRREAGEGVDESILAGARLRVRPIIMTALATIFALIPMSLGLTGGGVFISQPLAIVVIGGLISSTLLTLILVPVLYDLLEKGLERRRAKRKPSPELPVPDSV